MQESMLDLIVMGVMFAGLPALVLARRWDAVAVGETIPRACGPAPAPRPEAKPAAEPVSVPQPALAPAPSFLRLGRGNDSMDAERRARRHEGFVRAGY